MKRGQFYLIFVVLIITHGTAYFMGINFESAQNEKEIDLTFEVAAQQYKILQYDSSKFNFYGTERIKNDTSRRILPQNSRTKAAITQHEPKHEKISNTRKRN